MNDQFLNQLFSYYDKSIASLPLHYQALISFALLIFLIWNIYAFLKNGHWLFIAILLAALPGTWPATRKFAEIVWILVKGLIYRISS